MNQCPTLSSFSKRWFNLLILDEWVINIIPCEILCPSLKENEPAFKLFFWHCPTSPWVMFQHTSEFVWILFEELWIIEKSIESCVGYFWWFRYQIQEVLLGHEYLLTCLKRIYDLLLDHFVLVLFGPIQRCFVEHIGAINDIIWDQRFGHTIIQI